MGRMEPTPGRHVTRRLQEPRLITPSSQRTPGPAAHALAQAHNDAVRRHGSDSGGYHAFNPQGMTSDGVWDEGFPAGAVVTPLSWGRIDAGLAQRVLQHDGWTEG